MSAIPLPRSHCSLLPPVVQFLPGSDRVVMEGFQHMDFIVGRPEQIEKTAEHIVRCLDNGA